MLPPRARGRGRQPPGRERTRCCAEAAAEGRVVELPGAAAAADAAGSTPASPRRATAEPTTRRGRSRPPDGDRRDGDRRGRRADVAADAPTTPAAADAAGARRAEDATDRLPRAGYPAAVPDRLPPPARRSSASTRSASATRRFRAGMARPSDGARRLVAGRSSGSPTTTGVVSFRDVAPDGRPAAGSTARPARARRSRGALSGLILEDAGRLQMRLGAGRPARRPDPAVARARWRSGRPSGSSRPAPRRCGRTSSRRRCSPGSGEPSKGCTGPDPSRPRRLARRCATCSTTSWTELRRPRGDVARGGRRREREPPAGDDGRTTTAADDARRPDEGPDADPDDEPTTPTTTGCADDDDRPDRAGRRSRGAPRRSAAPRRRAVPTTAAERRPARAGAIGLVDRRSSSVIALILLFSVGHRPLDRRPLVLRASGSTASSGPGSARQVGLFVGALVVAPGRPARQPLARRPAGAAAGRRTGRLVPLVRRSAQRGRPGGRRPARRAAVGFGARPPRRTTRTRSSFDADDIPDLTPLGRGRAGRASPCCSPWSSPAPSSAAWETVLLWAHRVPFSPDRADRRHRPDLRPGHQLLPVRAAVPAPRPGRCSTALVLAALILALARYLVGGVARRPRLHRRRSASTSRSSAALFLLSVAFGYQLDKYELVYSTRGVATGVSFTDQNAQFFAFDVLTVISGLAAAFLVGGAFTRMLWPLGLTIARLVRRLASSSGGSTRRPIQRFTVEPEPVRPGRALHRATTSR